MISKKQQYLNMINIICQTKMTISNQVDKEEFENDISKNLIVAWDYEIKDSKIYTKNKILEPKEYDNLKMYIRSDLILIYLKSEMKTIIYNNLVYQDQEEALKNIYDCLDLFYSDIKKLEKTTIVDSFNVKHNNYKNVRNVLNFYQKSLNTNIKDYELLNEKCNHLKDILKNLEERKSVLNNELSIKRSIKNKSFQDLLNMAIANTEKESLFNIKNKIIISPTEFSFIAADVIIEYPYVVNQKHKYVCLGDIEFRVNMSKESIECSLSLETKNKKNSEMISSSFIHPHISGGGSNLCLGSGQKNFIDYCKKGSPNAIISFLNDSIRSYNPSSHYWDLGSYFKTYETKEEALKNMRFKK